MLTELTMGELMFYGGIAGIVFFGLLFVILWLVYEWRKKRLIRKIEQDIESR